MFPDGKRYSTTVGYYRSRWGERLQKLVLDAGFTCPNRDGTVGTGGCSFCDNAAFHPSYSSSGKSLFQQIDEGIGFHKVRYRGAGHYLAYFQSYSNTYGPVEHLSRLYREALSHPLVVGVVIGTRPDCVDDEKLDMIAALAATPLSQFGPKPDCSLEYPVVQIEFGIESCYDATLERIGRGHDFACASRAVEAAASRGLDVGAHFIFGLPGETRQMLLDQCALINALPLRSVKFHQLQIIKGTRMEQEYARTPGDFIHFGLDEYLDFIVDVLERLRPDLLIERVAGEVPPRFVGKSQWGLVRNFQILHLLDERLEARNTCQGRLFQ